VAGYQTEQPGEVCERSDQKEEEFREFFERCCYQTAYEDKRAEFESVTTSIREHGEVLKLMWRGTEEYIDWAVEYKYKTDQFFNRCLPIGCEWQSDKQRKRYQDKHPPVKSRVQCEREEKLFSHLFFFEGHEGFSDSGSEAESEGGTQSDHDFVEETDEIEKEEVVETTFMQQLQPDQQHEVVKTRDIERIEKQKNWFKDNCDCLQEFEGCEMEDVLEGMEEPSYKPYFGYIAYLQTLWYAMCSIKYSEWPYSDTVKIYRVCKRRNVVLVSESWEEIQLLCSEPKMSYKWTTWRETTKLLGCLIYGKSHDSLDSPDSDSLDSTHICFP